MAITNVLIEDEMGARVPSVSSVAVVAGDGVTFAAGDGADSVLYFSPSTAALLSPSPEGPVSLASGASISFTFGAPSGLAYGVLVQAPEVSAPADFDFGPPAEAATLVIEAGAGASFPGPNVPIKTG